MKAQGIFFLIILFGSALVLCGQVHDAALTVDIKATTRVPLPSTEPMMPIGGIMCDNDGNIYARLLTSNASREEKGVFRLPIVEITPDGTLARTFHVTEAGSGVIGKHIFVTSDGAVYQIAIASDGIYAVEFANDGAVKAKIKLEVDSLSVQPWDLAVFKSGEYLLTGETGKDGRTPYTAVFSGDGKLVKQIYQSEDDDARQKAESGDVEYAPSNLGNRFVSLGRVAAGTDGNVYLLRGTSPTLVYVISPKGEVIRKLHVSAGAPGSDARSIRSYSDRLVIGFAGPTTLLKVIDFQGTELANYTVAADSHLDLACYSSQGLTFIGTKQGERSYLLQTKLQ